MISAASRPYIDASVPVLREHGLAVTTTFYRNLFAELPELTRFFFVDLPVNPELISSHKQLKKLSNDELKSLLEKSVESLKQSDFSEKDLTDRLNLLLEDTGQKPVVLFSLIRIATTQAPASPGLADTLNILGKEKSLERIQAHVSNL